jgi:hypothetical protein
MTLQSLDWTAGSWSHDSESAVVCSDGSLVVVVRRFAVGPADENMSHHAMLQGALQRATGDAPSAWMGTLSVTSLG